MHAAHTTSQRSQAGGLPSESHRNLLCRRAGPSCQLWTPLCMRKSFRNVVSNLLPSKIFQHDCTKLSTRCSRCEQGLLKACAHDNQVKFFWQDLLRHRAGPRATDGRVCMSVLLSFHKQQRYFLQLYFLPRSADLNCRHTVIDSISMPPPIRQVEDVSIIINNGAGTICRPFSC